jgi:hypothetical protein
VFCRSLVQKPLPKFPDNLQIRIEASYYRLGMIALPDNSRTTSSTAALSTSPSITTMCVCAVASAVASTALLSIMQVNNRIRRETRRPRGSAEVEIIDFRRARRCCRCRCFCPRVIVVPWAAPALATG